MNSSWVSFTTGAVLSAVLLGSWKCLGAPRAKRAKTRAQLQRGKVYLIGAGPGNPSLLTLQAHQVLQGATVAVMDDLVSDELYGLLSSDCEAIYVGKRGGKKDSTKQVDIDAILVQKAQEGHIVVRVKGGDPMVFGRVHSEIRALCQHNCAFEVVPGISSVLAAPAVINIPITHKVLSRSFLVISGHRPADMDYAMLAQVDTLLILMATRTLRTICDELVAAGRPSTTPVALIHNATLPTQERLLGTLADIATKAETKSYSPAIIVIGSVAKYADLQTYREESEYDQVV